MKNSNKWYNVLPFYFLKFIVHAVNACIGSKGHIRNELENVFWQKSFEESYFDGVMDIMKNKTLFTYVVFLTGPYVIIADIVILFVILTS